MPAQPRPTFLCLASYFKGNRFFRRLREEGAYVILITSETFKDEAWDRSSIDEFHSVKSFEDRNALIYGIAWLFKERKIDRIIALDDFDVEVAANLREHFRIPGVGDTQARFFRDKLAMRMKAQQMGVQLPKFSPVFHHADVAKFIDETPAPWLLKPRSEASAVGIKKLHTKEQVWAALKTVGDRQSFHLIEQMIPGELYHVDSLMQDGKIVFAEVGKYGRPLLEVAHEGGIYCTRTVRSPEAKMLLAANEKVLTGFGLTRGASHTEFIIGKEDGKPYFIETSARVGGANIAEMVEAATGVNLWSEWAKLELEGDNSKYRVTPTRNEFGGVVISLAKQEQPDTSSFKDPEIIEHIKKKNHIGFVLQSKTEDRVQTLLANYIQRIATDYHAAVPPAERATT